MINGGGESTLITVISSDGYVFSSGGIVEISNGLFSETINHTFYSFEETFISFNF